jgi:CheY-like chemotaxis protein
MGGTVSATARYAETAPPRSLAQLAIEDAMSTPALTRCESSPQIGGTGGVFLHTEVSFDDGMSLALEEKTMSTSISLPSLTQAHSLTGHDANKCEELSSIQKDISKQSAPDRRAEARSAATRRHQRVMKAFTKAMSGKSILLLTEQKALRKQITSVLLKDDTNLRFIKTSNDLWPRLRDPKEQYHALLIDLTKSELPIEAILRTIRQDARYGNLPIVVLSSDRNLSDVVRACCSFVVFLPLAATMLREALVWCFDRASVQKLYQLEEEQLDLQCVRNFASGLNTSDAPLEVS